MQAQSNILRFIGGITLPLPVPVASDEEQSVFPRFPTWKDYTAIDWRIVNHVLQRFGKPIDLDLAREFREDVQIYSHVYPSTNHPFILSFPKHGKRERLDWKEVAEIMEEVASERGIILWYSTYSKSAYAVLDNYIRQRLRKKYQILISVFDAGWIREYAQVAHYIYSDFQTEVKILKTVANYFTLSPSETVTIERPNEYYLCSLEVFTWIQDWENIMLPFLALGYR